MSHVTGRKLANCDSLAHLEITEDFTLGLILRISGVREHNKACKEGLMKHIPYVPLHPHVYEVALQQLCVGARLVTISVGVCAVLGSV